MECRRGCPKWYHVDRVILKVGGRAVSLPDKYLASEGCPPMGGTLMAEHGRMSNLSCSWSIRNAFNSNAVGPDAFRS